MITRKAYTKVKDILLNTKRIPILVGLRRTGKSTILKQIQQELNNVEIIVCDDLFFRKLTEEELLEYIDEKIKGGAKYIFLDEIQVKEQWDVLVKNLFDRYVDNSLCKFVVTGSSSLSFENRDTGVTRTEKVLIHTLDFQEYLDFTKQEKTFDNFEKFLFEGAFPEFILDNKYTSQEMMDLSLKPIFYEDIPSVYRVSIRTLLRFVYELSVLTNGELNIAKSASNLGVKAEQINNFLDILMKTHIIKIVERINADGTFDRYRKIKVYMNPHFQLWLLNRKFSELDNKQKGHIVESYWLFWATQINGYYKMFYYLKTIDGKEIDFVTLVDGLGEFKTLHEFKYTDDVKFSELDLLIKTKAINKVVWCKETMKEKKHGIKFISILDADEN